MTATISHPQSSTQNRRWIPVATLVVAVVAVVVAVLALVSALNADGTTVAPKPATATAEAPAAHGLAVDAAIAQNQSATPASFTCTPRAAFSKC